jgi:hypothetical protein
MSNEVCSAYAGVIEQPNDVVRHLNAKLSRRAEARAFAEAAHVDGDYAIIARQRVANAHPVIKAAREAVNENDGIPLADLAEANARVA